MNLVEKAAILGNAGRWDACTAGLPSVVNKFGGICRSTTEGGGCMRLFKTLMTNECSFDCRYCQNSVNANRQTASYRPEELARVFVRLYEGNLADGLFLTSAVSKSADDTTSGMLEALKLIRLYYGFRGYVHFKILPGASREYVREACVYADRVSVNIEAPGANFLSELSGMKDFKVDILRRQRWIRDFKPTSGQTTQMVVGAGCETDIEVLKTALWEYETMGVRRTYYSAFTPLEGTPLEHRKKTQKSREHNLYCVDYMMRKYGIPLEEFKGIMTEGNLPEGDPKINLALNRLDRPLDINEASYDDLVRIPGIGSKTALGILCLREKDVRLKTRKQLSVVGVAVKRAEPFIKINGRCQKKLKEYYNK
jgi:predicted DNA-binding helix-hairpin-helix protein